MQVVIASDHGGFELKRELAAFIQSLGLTVDDLGTDSAEAVDYPDYALKVALRVKADPENVRGIMIDGVGIGSAITANKVPGIRAAACYETFMAQSSREHNDTNVLTLGARVTGSGLAKEIVRTWLNTPFGGIRHQRRIEKMLQVERRFLKERM